MRPFLWVGLSVETAAFSWPQDKDDAMGALETSAVPAMVLLSILRREMKDILIYLSDRCEITEVFNHLFPPPTGYTILTAGPTNE